MIKEIVFDVDGTLTDGNINISQNGEIFKAFNIKDGYGISNIAIPNKIKPIIMTGRESEIIVKRCNELGINDIYQGVKDKEKKIIEICKDLSETAYIGDDLNDFLCMKLIKKNGGVVGCPSDAAKEIVLFADYVSTFRGGDGAARDFIEYIIEHNKKPKENLLQTRINEAIAYLESLNTESIQLGEYIVNDNFYYNVQMYETKDENECLMESHRKYIDIHWVIEGQELVELKNISTLIQKNDYDEKRDIAFWQDTTPEIKIKLKKGSYTMIYPSVGHKSGIKVERKLTVKKIVGKVKI